MGASEVIVRNRDFILSVGGSTGGFERSKTTLDFVLKGSHTGSGLPSGGLLAFGVGIILICEGPS